MIVDSDRRILQLIADGAHNSAIAERACARAILALEASLETLRTLVRDNADACSAHHTDGAAHRPRLT